jgi:hypothetical protein
MGKPCPNEPVFCSIPLLFLLDARYNATGICKAYSNLLPEKIFVGQYYKQCFHTMSLTLDIPVPVGDEKF